MHESSFIGCKKPEYPQRNHWPYTGTSRYPTGRNRTLKLQWMCQTFNIYDSSFIRCKQPEYLEIHHWPDISTRYIIQKHVYMYSLRGRRGVNRCVVYWEWYGNVFFFFTNSMGVVAGGRGLMPNFENWGNYVFVSSHSLFFWQKIWKICIFSMEVIYEWQIKRYNK